MKYVGSIPSLTDAGIVYECFDSLVLAADSLREFADTLGNPNEDVGLTTYIEIVSQYTIVFKHSCGGVATAEVEYGCLRIVGVGNSHFWRAVARTLRTLARLSTLDE